MKSTPPAGRAQGRKILMFATIEFVVMGALVTPLVVSLSLKVLTIVDPSGKEAALGLVTAVGAISAMIFNPIFGHLSDRTTSRFGRRRPWIVGGSILGLVASLAVALAPNVAVLVAAWALVQLAYNAVLAPLSALLADQIDETHRAKASGVFGAAGGIGIVPALVVATLFSSNQPLLFTIMPAIAAVVTVIVCLRLKDEPLDKASAPPLRLGSILSAFVFDPRTAPLFGWAWLQRFTMQLGYTLAGSFGLYFLMLRLAVDAPGATPLVTGATLVSALVMMIASFLGGLWAGRRGNYGPFIVVAAGLLILSLLINAFASNALVYIAATGVAGFGIGMYYAVDLALAMRVLPPQEAGRYLGVFNVAKTLPQSLAPALAPLILLVGGTDPVAGGEKNYAALYLVGAAFAAVSLLALLKLRPALHRPATIAAETTTPNAIPDPEGPTHAPAAQPLS